MPNIKSAKKREAQSARARIRNIGHRSRARTYMKKVLSLIEKKDHPAALTAFNEMQSVLDKSAKLGIFHPNKVARHKSRINAKIKALVV